MCHCPERDVYWASSLKVSNTKDVRTMFSFPKCSTLSYGLSLPVHADKSPSSVDNTMTIKTLLPRIRHL